MAYVLEVISKDGKIKYINSAKATVYCPEYAARYDDKKTAMTVAAALLRNECYQSISVKKLSLELCVCYLTSRIRIFDTQNTKSE